MKVNDMVLNNNKIYNNYIMVQNFYHLQSMRESYLGLIVRFWQLLEPPYKTRQ